MADIKVLIAEIDGTETEYPEERVLQAIDTKFDITTPIGAQINKTNTQEALEAVFNKTATSASPGFSFGRAGNTNAGTFLQCESVPSNVAGRWVYINNAKVKKVFVSNELVSSYTVEVMYHDGGGANLTSLGTVSVVSATGDAFSVDWSVPIDKQIALRVSVGSVKNIICGLELEGTKI